MENIFQPKKTNFSLDSLLDSLRNKFKDDFKLVIIDLKIKLVAGHKIKFVKTLQIETGLTDLLHHIMIDFKIKILLRDVRM